MTLFNRDKTDLGLDFENESSKRKRYNIKNGRSSIVKAPPPLIHKHHRRSLGLDFNNTTKQGFKFRKENHKYDKETEVARQANLNRNQNPEPFKVKNNELFLKVAIADCLFAHNEIRKKHNMSNLLWDPDLSYYAEEWALVLAARAGSETSKFRESSQDIGSDIDFRKYSRLFPS